MVNGVLRGEEDIGHGPRVSTLNRRTAATALQGRLSQSMRCVGRHRHVLPGSGVHGLTLLRRHPHGAVGGGSARSLPSHSDMQVCVRESGHIVSPRSHTWKQPQCHEAQSAGAAYRDAPAKG